MFDPVLYVSAALLYAAQAQDALSQRHPCTVYAGLAVIHLALGMRKLVWM